MNKISLILFFIFANLSYGQQQIVSNSFHININTQLFNSMVINNTIGDNLVKSKQLLSAEITLSYHVNLKYRLGLNFGFGLGLAPDNVNYYFKTPNNSIFNTGIYADEYEYLDANYTDYVNFLWVFPLYLDKQITIRDKLFILTLGTKLNLINASPSEIQWKYSYYIDQNNTDVTLFDASIYNNQKTLFSYFFKIGTVIKLKKKQLQLHLEYQSTDKPIMQGKYSFYNLPSINSGTLNQKLNYIGISLSY